jgi:hypothetical protein
MCNQSNGGFMSALTLINALRKTVDVETWSLWGKIDDDIDQQLSASQVSVKLANPVPSINEGDHLFLYMNDYPTLFGNFSREWQQQVDKSESVQIAFNRNLGSMPEQAWLADKLTHIYFQDAKMQNDWRFMTKRNELSEVSTSVLASPVELDSFCALAELRQNRGLQTKLKTKLIFGRLAGDGAVEADSIPLYSRLAAALPNAEFWFMPTPSVLKESFRHNPQFRFLEPNEVTVHEFLLETDIFLLTYKKNTPVPGTRSLIEAMAAGCAPVVINREGPKARVQHAQNGFCANNNEEFFDYSMQLANDEELLKHYSSAAADRANTFKVKTWTDAIISNLAG